MDEQKKPVLKFSIEEPSLTSEGCWNIDVYAARDGIEEMLGYVWTALWDDTAPTAAVLFHQPEATTVMRLLYSTFAALHDPKDYMAQIEFGGLPDTSELPGAMVGSIRGQGAMQAYVRWQTSPRAVDFMIYPADPAAKARAIAVLGVQSVVNIIRATEEAFKSLGWPIPD